MTIASFGSGGTDNVIWYSSSFSDEGADGSGGYPETQGYWMSGIYQGGDIANQTYGFSFGQGQATTSQHDTCGSGGG